MSVTILIPSALRPFTDRKSELEAEGATVGEALANLVGQYPDLKRQIYEDDGKLRGFVNVFVEGTDVETERPGHARRRGRERDAGAGHRRGALSHGRQHFQLQRRPRETPPGGKPRRA